MSIDFYSDTDQELINNVQDYRESSLEAHYYTPIYTVCNW